MARAGALRAGAAQVEITPRHEVHAPTLVVRSSTGPPPLNPKALA